MCSTSKSMPPIRCESWPVAPMVALSEALTVAQRSRRYLSPLLRVRGDVSKWPGPAQRVSCMRRFRRPERQRRTAASFPQQTEEARGPRRPRRTTCQARVGTTTRFGSIRPTRTLCLRVDWRITAAMTAARRSFESTAGSVRPHKRTRTTTPSWSRATSTRQLCAPSIGATTAAFTRLPTSTRWSHKLAAARPPDGRI